MAVRFGIWHLALALVLASVLALALALVLTLALALALALALILAFELEFNFVGKSFADAGPDDARTSNPQREDAMPLRRDMLFLSLLLV